MNRKYLFALPLFALITSIVGCNNQTLIVPEFKESKGINFNAYAGPTIKAWNNVVTLTDEHYKKVAEAGFNQIIALYEGACGTGSSLEETLSMRAERAAQDAMIALPLAEKYGLKYYVRDWNLYGLSRGGEYCYDHGVDNYDQFKWALKNYILADDNEYVHSPAFAGCFTFDEPHYNELELLGDLVRAEMERLQELGEGEHIPYVNLLPNIASNNTMNGHSYSQYLDKYIECVGKQVGYLSYDFYPLMGGNKKDPSYVRTIYLNNLQIAQEKCKANNLELRTFVQSKGDFTGMRDITSTADIRFQVYTNLAFGSRSMTYYEYGGKNDQTEGEFSLFNLTKGTYNWTYNCAKTVNNEVHNFEDALLAYEYEDVMCKSVDEIYENQNFLNLMHYSKSHEKAKFVSVEQDTLMTSFKNKSDGSPAFMLVNFSDPYDQLNDEVTIKFDGAKGLLMYRFGQKMIANLPRSGEYTFKLSPGEGRFIIPLY